MESDREIDNILQFYYAGNYPEYKNICWWWSHNLSTQSSERRLIPYNDSSSSSKGQSYGDGSDESMGLSVESKEYNGSIFGILEECAQHL